MLLLFVKLVLFLYPTALGEVSLSPTGGTDVVFSKTFVDCVAITLTVLAFHFVSCRILIFGLLGGRIVFGIAEQSLLQRGPCLANCGAVKNGVSNTVHFGRQLAYDCLEEFRVANGCTSARQGPTYESNRV